MSINNPFPLDAGLEDQDLESLSLVSSIMLALTKFINGKRIYAKNNPTLIKFAGEFQDAVKTFFAKEEELVLDIEKNSITWREQPVYENTKRDESLAFMLFRDGVGQITLKRDIEFEELERFVDLLKGDACRSDIYEDTVTKLWRADFNKIHYRVLDEYLVGQFGDGKAHQQEERPLEVEDHPDLPSLKDKGRVILSNQDPIEPIDRFLYRLSNYSPQNQVSEEDDRRFQDVLAMFFTVSSEELKICQEEIRAEQREDGLASFVQTMLDFTLLQENPSAVRDVTNIVEHTLDYLVEEARPSSLNQVLATVRRFRDKQELPQSTLDFFDRLEEKATDTALLVKLCEDLDRSDPRADETFQFYRTVGRKSIPAICALLDQLTTPSMHEMACDVLLDVAEADVPQIVEKLNLDNSKLARDAVYLTARSDHDRVPPIIRQLAVYPDSKVRDEVIKYLVAHEDEDAAIILVELMEDEDKNVRTKVLNGINGHHHPIVKNRVKSLAFDKELSERQHDEQELVFKVLGMLWGEEVLPDLANIVDKKSLLGFARKQGKSEKILAIRAYEQIGGPEVLQCLRSLLDDKNEMVKSRAKRALRTLEQESDNG